MATIWGPNIVTDNLKLYVDAANKESYPQTGTTWTDLSGEGNDGTISGATLSSENTKNSVTGGTITNDGEYIIHTFTSTGSTNFVTDVALTADVLIVGGGGSGGYALGGGGGGGGVVHLQGLSVAAGTHSMVVGAGGTGGSSHSDGSNSAAFSSTAYGGGSGGQYPTDSGNGGGSGGGAGSNDTQLSYGGTSTKGALGGNPGTTYGNDGGDQTATRSGSPTSARGGGGAGAAGADENSNNTDGGEGGAGIQINIDGNNYYWAAGGGGSGYTGYYGGDGGLGGGGGASNNAGGGETPATGGGDGGTGGINNGAAFSSYAGGAGGANTGSGGGGGSWNTGSGGAGGSGIVIVRYHRSFAPRRFYFGFDRTTPDYIAFPNTLTHGSDGTIEVWFKTSYTGSLTSYLLGHQNSTGGTSDFAIFLEPSGTRRMGVWARTPAPTSYYLYTTGAMNDGVWRQMVVTWGSVSYDLYINGAVMATNSWTGWGIAINGHWALGTIHGSSAASASYSWDGDIAGAKIYTRGLTPAEILQNFNAHKGRYGL